MMIWLIFLFLCYKLITTLLEKRRETLAKQEESEKRDAYRQRLQRDPRNAAALESMGDSFRRSGCLQDAHCAYATAFALNVFENKIALQYKMEQVERDMQTPPARTPRERLHAVLFPGQGQTIKFCTGCGAANPVHQMYCDQCKRLMHTDTFSEAWQALWRDPAERRSLLETMACLVIIFAALRLCSGLSILTQASLFGAVVIVLAWKFLKFIEHGSRG